MSSNANKKPVEVKCNCCNCSKMFLSSFTIETLNEVHLCVDARHWKELMEMTGTNFEVNTESFTLENMFAMELHKHSAVIEEIVTCAVKELGIEKASCVILLYFLLLMLFQASCTF